MHYLWLGEFCTIHGLFYFYQCWEFVILKGVMVTDYHSVSFPFQPTGYHTRVYAHESVSHAG